MSSRAEKIAASRPGNIYLILQPGQNDIDEYSLVLCVPVAKEAAFQRALLGASFNAGEYGQLLHYSAGRLTAEEALKKIKPA